MTTASAMIEQARHQRLYPSVILYGGSSQQRQEEALQAARALLCAKPVEQRGCDPDAPDSCQHCRRVLWPEKAAERFHPDLHVLKRDLRTTTSVDATKAFAARAISAPFEARGQVFVVAEADSLSGGAADALLKLLEEPPIRSPRNFLLLTGSQHDLLPTLRSRSLAVFLGSTESLDGESLDSVVEQLSESLDSFFQAPSALYLLTAADALAGVGGFQDPRARRPWASAAAAVVRYAESARLDRRQRRAVLDLADALLDAPRWRVRGIQPARLLEGLVARHLADIT